MKNLNRAEFEFIMYTKGTAGSFSTSLFETIIKADIFNRRKLEVVFPEEVQIINNFQNTSDYFENLKNRFQLEFS